MSDPGIVLRAEGLTRRFDLGGSLADRLRGRRRTVTAVDAVDLELRRGEIFALVGESGSGKSTLGRLLLRLIEPSAGRVLMQGEDVAGMTGAALMRFRRRAQAVFQDPFSSLNPRMRIGAQLREPLDIHRIGAPAGRAARVEALLDRVGLSPDHARAYPAELSGGQRQRVGIALALASAPEIIVADEPTSALDVSIQAQILNLLARLQADEALTLLFITHDLGVVRHFCDRVAVMYLGRIVEQADKATLFSDPQHPYTRMLLSAIPEPDPSRPGTGQLPTGDPPSPLSPPPGCPFHPRCAHAMPRCARERPGLRASGGQRQVACFLHDDEPEPIPTRDRAGARQG